MGGALGIVLGPLEVGCTQAGWRTGPRAFALAPSGCKVSLGVFSTRCWRCSVLAPMAWGRSLSWGHTARGSPLAVSGSSRAQQGGGDAAPCPAAAPGLQALLLGALVLLLAGCCLLLPACFLLPATALSPPVCHWHGVLGPWTPWPSSIFLSLPEVSSASLLC